MIRSAARHLRALAVAAVVLFPLATVAQAENGGQTTLLLTPSGQPVGGRWQRWMNDSYMPTYQGSMVLDLALADLTSCGSRADACTGTSGFTPDLSAAVATDPETVERPMSARQEHWVLLYEQAHVIDYRNLTNAERSSFLSLWRQPQPPADESMSDYWWQGEAALGTDEAPVYGEWFSDDYQLCAMVQRWTLTTAGATIASWPLSFTDGFPGIEALANLSWTHKHGKWAPLRRDITPDQRVTARDRWGIRTQQGSCGLIRSWIAAAAH